MEASENLCVRCARVNKIRTASSSAECSSNIVGKMYIGNFQHCCTPMNVTKEHIYSSMQCNNLSTLSTSSIINAIKSVNGQWF